VSRKDIKIFGERNTATNALKQLIERNSTSRVLPSTAREFDSGFGTKVRVISKLPFGAMLREIYIDRVFRGKGSRLSWKHTATNFSDIEDLRDCIVLLTTRHPASWLLALYRRPYHRVKAGPVAFSDFLTTKWKTVKRDKLEDRFVTPSEIWNAKMCSYVAFSKNLGETGITCRWVRFEDFVCDQPAVFDGLRDVLLDPADAVSVIAESTKDRSKDFRYYRDYYANVRWLSEIDEASRKLIDSTVNWEVAGDFGYCRLAHLAAD
jgi:hypothetical protein